MAIYFVLTTISCLINNLIKKVYLDKTQGNVRSYGFYVLLTTIISTIVFFACGNFSGVSYITWVLGALFGMVTVLQYYFGAMALANGTYAFTMLMASLSTIIPALSGAIFWGEKISLLQVLGIVLIMAFFIIVFNGKKERFSISWLISSIAMFVSTGIIGVVQKWFAKSKGSAQILPFLTIAFAMAFLFSLVFYLFTLKKNKSLRSSYCNNSIKPLVILIAFIVIGAIGGAVNNYINLFLVKKTTSAMFFPLVNGLSVVLNSACGVFVFKERFSLKMWIGMVVGVVAIVLLCLPF